MSDIQDISSVVNSAAELLDDIRGGAISRMKAQHDESMQQFGTERQGALNAFADEKSQSLTEFNSQKNAALNSFDQQGKAKIAEVDKHLSLSRDAQSHFRVSKNQILKSTVAGNLPDGWYSGALVRAEVVEKVVNGVEPAERSQLAQEFLEAINCNQKFFASSFDIWELEIEAPESVDSISNYFFYQRYYAPSTLTIGAIVKHLSGPVPYGEWCNNLEAGQPAKLCGYRRMVGTNRNHYSHCHPRLLADGSGQNAVIQVALPAVVTGDVDLTKGAWGQFPFIGEQAYN